MIKSLLRKLVFILNGRTVLINKEKIAIPEKFITHFNVRKNNPAEPELYAVVKRLIRKDDVFIDIGANMGMFSLMASDKSGATGSVIVVEPNPITFGFLSEIIAKNKKYENLIMLQVAIADQLSMLPLQLNQDQDSVLMERASIVHTDRGARTVNVFTNRLDNLLPSAVKPSIMKIDVEGAELAVLEGSRKIIEAARPMVCVEVHGLYFENPEIFVSSVFTFFQSMGYQGINIFKGGIETVKSFMEDSGAGGIDPISKKELRGLGYGNLIFFANEEQKKLIVDSIQSN